MSTKIDDTVPTTPPQFTSARKANMSTVLQVVQEALNKATSRPDLDRITLELQKLIADDLKLQFQEKETLFDARYRTYTPWRGERTVDAYYRDTCVHFALRLHVELHRMYAATAAALHVALSQPPSQGKSQNYQATEALAQSSQFKLALKNVPDGYNDYVPAIPDFLTTTDLPLRAEMSPIHALLTRLRDV